MVEQSSLFSDVLSEQQGVSALKPDITLIPDFLDKCDADKLQMTLRAGIEWEQSTIRLYGKLMKIPRLNAFYGDEGCTYQYSKKTFQAHSWTTELSDIKNRIELATNFVFNSVLLNCYRHGQDSMGWHSDDEPELGKNPVIASLSLGQTRYFHMRHKTNKTIPVRKIPLSSGCLLIMQGSTQHHWQHQIAKTRKFCHERINLTFRRVIS